MIFLFFFSSGFAALLYQAVWLKYLGLLLGNTTYATAAVLSAFMAGLAIGSWATPRLSILFRNGLRSYGLIEALIGIFAAAFPALYTGSKVPFAALFNLVGPQTTAYTAIVFATAFLVLVIPTTLMGASLPILAHVIVRGENIGAKTGLLYAVNTAGAVAGIFCSAFFLIPALGLNGTIYVGVLINLLVGLACFFMSSSDPTGSAQPAKAIRHRLLWLYLISGLLALGYEVFWTRILVLHLGSDIHSYAIMLSVFLLGISIGSTLGGKWLDRSGTSPELAFGYIQLAWAISILIQLWGFAHLADLLTAVASLFKELNYSAFIIVLFTCAVLVLLVPTFLSGALFPAVVKAILDSGATIEKATSSAYSYNTIGGIFGSIVAAFLLIPIFGTQTGLIIFAAINLILGWAACLTSKSRKPGLLLAFTVIFLMLGFFVNTKIHVMQNAGIFRSEGQEQLLHLEEDASATISVEKRMYFGKPYLSLSINGVNVAGSSPELVAIQKMQGNLPMILYGAGKPARILHIGFGSGGTAYSVSLYPKTDITVVELSRGVVRNAAANFQLVNHGIVSSGRLHFIYFDGRSYLQNTREMYDLILSDSIHPRYSGNGSLYTKDYYELVNAHLNRGGVHSQWIPTYSLSQKNLREILRAFWEVFPETYVWYINSTVNPYIVVTGTKSGGIPFNSLIKTFGDSATATDLKDAGATGPYFILDYFLFGPKGLANYVKDSNPHMDDRLSVEYESARVLDAHQSWILNYVDLLHFREPVTSYLTDSAGFDVSEYSRFYDATTKNLQGQLAFLNGNKQSGQQSFQEAHRINPQDHDPYESNFP